MTYRNINYEDDTYELTTVDGAVCNENRHGYIRSVKKYVQQQRFIV